MKRFTVDDTQLTCRAVLEVAGCTCTVATNDSGLLGFLEPFRSGSPRDCGEFEMRVMVHDEPGEPHWLPHFRGLHHLVFASFGQFDLFVFDLEQRRVSAAISKRLARDHTFWHERMVPIIIGVLGCTVGVLPFHSACLSINGDGLLIAGPSGAGKSTLSVALAKLGFDFVSDDWTYINCVSRFIEAHGLLAPIKLLPDAIKHFPELTNRQVCVAMNGELAYEASPESTFSISVARRCRPRWLVFFDRTAGDNAEFVEISPDTALAYIDSNVERLPVQLATAAENRETIKEKIATLSCWRFQHDGPPEDAARELYAFVSRQLVGASA